jgi:hypothetical protein
MRAIRLASAGTAAAVLLLATPSDVLGQAEPVGEDPRYFYGELEGFLHPDTDNPFGCEVGFTSDSTLFGESTLLGTTTLRQVNCYVPADTLGNVQDAVFTFTGESGDTLSGAALEAGDCIPDDATDAGDYYSCWGKLAITGGTGAFDGASGEIHIFAYTWNTQSDHPEAAPGDVPAMVLLEGLIDY